jgi:iron complex transport system ATP-binding protein
MRIFAKNIIFAYYKEPVIHGVNFRIEPSEMLGIIGPNGSGKTTMLKCINRILNPRSGQILMDGRDIAGMKRLDISKQIGYVPQNSYGGYDSPTVFEVVLMGRRPHDKWASGRKDKNKVWEVLASMNLERFAARRFDELSGGERQKVMIARALAQEARILLLDEPTNNLDIKHQIDVMDLLKDLADSQGFSVCAVVHNLDLAAKYCDRTILMHRGQVFASGPTPQVITTENIKSVYGVDIIIDHSHGRPHVVVV